jgi:hypothetical protein
MAASARNGLITGVNALLVQTYLLSEDLCGSLIVAELRKGATSILGKYMPGKGQNG